MEEVGGLRAPTSVCGCLRGLMAVVTVDLLSVCLLLTCEV